jgi:uncharacterized protein (UPF0262 family)
MKTTPGKARSAAPQRIAAITLDEHTVVRRSPTIEHERATAITDLLKDNRFTPQSGRAGPFHLHLAIAENRLAIEIRTPGNAPEAGPEGEPSETIVLPLAPFRRIVKDYFLVCERYYGGLQVHHTPEALDVGRRSLHDAGADLLMEQLADQVAIDHDTARGLFTLICVLHLRAAP